MEKEELLKLKLNSLLQQIENLKQSIKEVQPLLLGETNPILNKRIASCPLRERTINCLIMGLKEGPALTVGDVIKYSPRELMRLRYFGSRSCSELIFSQLL